MPMTGLKNEGAQPILVFSDHGRSMGLVVDEIVDIVEDKLDIEVASNRPGVLGYAVIKGNTTEIVDVGAFPAAGLRGLVPPPRRSERRHRRARFCWSMTRRFSATCWRR